MNAQLPIVPTQEAEHFLQAAALDTVSAVAAVMSNPATLAHSAVRLVRAAQRGRFLEQLCTEWAELKADGHIKNDYGTTDQCRAEFADILESLEDANLDQEQLDLLRKLFLAAASEQLTNRTSPLPREYLAIGRALSTAEIELLAQTYRHVAKWSELDATKRHSDAGSWLRLMIDSTGLKHQALIEIHERRLIEKGLLYDRVHGDRSGIATTTQSYRLTDLGFAFCKFLALYDEIAAESQD